MKVEKVFGKIGERTVLKTDAKYTPYVICSNYDENKPDGSKWSSAYGYYSNKQELAATLLSLMASGYEFHGELIF